MAVNGRSLKQSDFIPLAMRGWGDGWNAYVHSMTWFEGHLYCGTFRAHLCFKQRQKENGPKFPVWPIQCPDDMFKTLDLRAQIWRFDPVASEWNNVYRAPMVKGKNGVVERECGYRGMAVAQGRSDSKPNLYVLPFSTARSIGPVMLRSEDGKHFEAVSKPGLGH